MHMVRNSVDHGIETPGGTAARRETAEARVTLKPAIRPATS